MFFVDLIKRKAGDFRKIKGAKNLSKSYFLPRPLYKLPSCLFSVNTKLPDIPSTNKRVASCTKLQLKVQILVHSLSNPSIQWMSNCHHQMSKQCPMCVFDMHSNNPRKT